MYLFSDSNLAQHKFPFLLFIQNILLIATEANPLSEKKKGFN